MDARADFPPLEQALVKAVACEAVELSGLPLSRLSTADIAGKARQALGKALSPSTGWRILAADTINPGRDKYWIFPRDPHFAEKAGRVVDLYAGSWQGHALGPKDSIISADEKTSIQARLRCHPSLPPAPGRGSRVEHEYERGGALQYLAALNVPSERNRRIAVVVPVIDFSTGVGSVWSGRTCRISMVSVPTTMRSINNCKSACFSANVTAERRRRMRAQNCVRSVRTVCAWSSC